MKVRERKNDLEYKSRFFENKKDYLLSVSNVNAFSTIIVLYHFYKQILIMAQSI